MCSLTKCYDICALCSRKNVLIIFTLSNQIKSNTFIQEETIYLNTLCNFPASLVGNQSEKIPNFPPLYKGKRVQGIYPYLIIFARRICIFRYFMKQRCKQGRRKDSTFEKVRFLRKISTVRHFKDHLPPSHPGYFLRHFYCSCDP